MATATNSSPRAYALTAACAVDSLYNAIEIEQADSKGWPKPRAFASKAAERAARIAGVITLFNDPHAHEIDEPAMFGAMELVNFYLSEHLRLMGTGKQAQTDKRLRALWDWLQTQDAIVTTRHIAQKAPRAVRNLQTKGMAALLDSWHQRGYIRNH